ncbi:hypothetical protein PIB30_037111 [Stylosanthes scabra]|uniref:Methyltransferase n=1 Tax=Stylosanthes scabra TaxID=79078 RepID=A0ABU6YCI0_9FABA|nr:hypothetical protein [Stylosanthes scabra]
MAMGKYSRVDGRRSSSSYCSTVTIVVFVALCLAGVWMMTSSSVVPEQNRDVSQEDKVDMKEQNEIKEQVSEVDSGNTRQFEDNPGDLPEDATKGDSNATSEDNSNSTENKEDTSSEGAKTEDTDKKTEDEDSKAENTESNSEASENNKGSDEMSTKETDSDGSEKNSGSDESENKSDNNETMDVKVEKVEQSDNNESDESSSKNTDEDSKNQKSNEVYPSGAQSELLNENKADTGSWSTQAAESKNEKESQKSSKQYSWKLCNTTAGPDFIPCLDNWKAIRSLRSTKHYEHRERHCPEEAPTCLVPLPEGYKRSVEWPKSREKIWYYNVPHTKLAQVKGHQNWVKVTGEYLTFPGGGTQFKHGALHYIDFIQESVPDIAWGKRTRVILDVGCGGKLLLELNRVLRPGGFFVWSATPVYQKLDEDVEIWNAMKKLTKAMCWELISISKDQVNGVGVAVYKKPTSNECYEARSMNEPPICQDSDDPNAAWNVPLQACMHKAPVSSTERGSQWPEQWPTRLTNIPYWLSSDQVGVYGKPAPEDFSADYKHWKRVVSKSYLNGMGIQWSNIRNVMDMNAIYGGFAAALKDRSIWVMNIKKRCTAAGLMAEVDRILRPEGKLIVRDTVETIEEVENMARSMKWQVRMTYSKEKEGMLCVEKSRWRPEDSEALGYATV